MNCYKILRVKPTATRAEISAAAERLKSIWNPEGYDAHREVAFCALSDIEAAREVLLDPERRRKHDEKLARRNELPENSEVEFWCPSGHHGVYTRPWGGNPDAASIDDYENMSSPTSSEARMYALKLSRAASPDSGTPRGREVSRGTIGEAETSWSHLESERIVRNKQILLGEDSERRHEESYIYKYVEEDNEPKNQPIRSLSHSENKLTSHSEKEIQRDSKQNRKSTSNNNKRPLSPPPEDFPIDDNLSLAVKRLLSSEGKKENSSGPTRVSQEGPYTSDRLFNSEFNMANGKVPVHPSSPSPKSFKKYAMATRGFIGSRNFDSPFARVEKTAFKNCSDLFTPSISENRRDSRIAQKGFNLRSELERKPRNSEFGVDTEGGMDKIMTSTPKRKPGGISPPNISELEREQLSSELEMESERNMGKKMTSTPKRETGGPFAHANIPPKISDFYKNDLGSSVFDSDRGTDLSSIRSSAVNGARDRNRIRQYPQTSAEIPQKRFRDSGDPDLNLQLDMSLSKNSRASPSPGRDESRHRELARKGSERTDEDLLNQHLSSPERGMSLSSSEDPNRGRSQTRRRASGSGISLSMLADVAVQAAVDPPPQESPEFPPRGQRRLFTKTSAAFPKDSDVVSVGITKENRLWVLDDSLLICRSTLSAEMREPPDDLHVSPFWRGHVKASCSRDREDPSAWHVRADVELEGTATRTVYSFRGDGDEVVEVYAEGVLVCRILNGEPADDHLNCGREQQDGGPKRRGTRDDLSATPLTVSSSIRANGSRIQAVRVMEGGSDVVEVYKDGVLLHRISSPEYPD